MGDLTTIEHIAHSILEQEPGEVVRFRLLRDVLRTPVTDPELREAREGLDRSHHVQILAGEQREDGGWGPFHSRSTKLKQRIISTEVGVERALALGLDRSHPILHRAADYIISVMEGEIPFPDYHEKNDRWTTGMRMFLASTLSLIVPDHPLLDKNRKLWVKIVRIAFQSGWYDENDEIQAHAELTGATVKDSYLVLNGRYQLNILGSVPGLLPDWLERALLEWLWQREDGIGYLEAPLGCPPPQRAGDFGRWMTSLELLSRLFPRWVFRAEEAIDWLWNERDDSGLWDFGSRASTSTTLPLSNSWHRRENRVFDWTTRVLVLLRRYLDNA
jgi:hypothetical protein